MTAKEIGNFGEAAAAKYLEENGISVIKRNFHCREGEIDIIAKDKNVIAFVEVKTRKSKDYGTPAEFVGFRKQQKIMKTAMYYVKRDDIDIRFDVIEVIYIEKFDGAEVTEISYIKNAFGGF
ncbi:MAG: YraN family protein [Firmicutes bacterium]|nr:YraN family protein [Bacillota bacterium]